MIKNTLAVLATVAAIVGLSWPGLPAQAGKSSAKVTIFRHVDVLPMDRDIVLRDQLVVVRGDVIAVVRSDRPGVSGFRGREIDGRGATLMPGLADFHTHSEGWEEMPAYVAAGVTTIANMGGETLSGRWREGRGLPKPNQIVVSETLDGNPPTNRRFYPIDAENAGAILDGQRAKGAVFFKVYGKLTDPARTALLAAARARGLTVGGHIPRGADLKTLFGQGYGMVAHGEEYLQYLQNGATPDRIDDLARITSEAGVVVTPNLVGYTAMPRQAADLDRELARPGVALLSSSVYEEWLPRANRYANRPDPKGFAKRMGPQLDTLKQLTARLYARGVLLLAGTDAPVLCLPGECLHEELRLMASSGLGNYQALRAATVNAGIFDGRLRHAAPAFGVIAPGMRADILLVRGDPRQDLSAIEHPQAVMVAGAWYPAAALRAAEQRIGVLVAPRHALVDRYNKLIDSKDLAPLFAFLDKLPRGANVLNDNVMIFDALTLEQDKRAADAIALLEHGIPGFRYVPGMWRVLGTIKANAGDRGGARLAYQAALRLRPYDAGALAGLKALTAGG